MGDRGNIVMRYDSGSGSPKDIWFYSHWNGTELGERLRNALLVRERWNDAPYLARIIFCKVIDDNTSGTTSYGISPYMCDNEHGILIVDVDAQSVMLHSEADGAIGAQKKLWSFEEFCKLPDDQCVF